MGRYLVDFHIHSRFSVATSKNLVPEQLEYWGRLKGLSVIGTGDIAHPGWLAELREKLEPAGNGLYRLRDAYRIQQSRELDHPEIPREIYFLLTGEISSIYKRDGKVRKVHNIAIMNGFDAAEDLQLRLGRLGNITSDGRPILGVDSRDILSMTLESGRGSYLIPAHIWTPWFSVLGSKSGFDSIEECYGDLSREIVALETGLSSDPAMNRCCSILDPYRLVSNSDAHSPEKLGREATVFEGDRSYEFLYQALKTGSGYRGTIEFFPEEGKYHLDGHRKCGVVWGPLETARHEGLCPVCGHEVTRGVMYRVAELADRTLENTKVEEFVSITQLNDLLAEMSRVKNPQSKKITDLYHSLVRRIGSEFHILLDAPLDLLEREGGPLFAEGIRRLRAREVTCEGGYDGEFGHVTVFSPQERGDAGLQLFSSKPSGTKAVYRSGFNFSIDDFRALTQQKTLTQPSASQPVDDNNHEQREAVTWSGSPLQVISGPGTGKTRVLVERILRILGSDPNASIAAVTFTNRASSEILERVGAGDVRLFTGTFHALGLYILERCGLPAGLSAGFSVISHEERRDLCTGIPLEQVDRLLETYNRYRERNGEQPDADCISRYRKALNDRHAIDVTDCLYLPVSLMREDAEYLARSRKLFTHLLIDEFQDVNFLQYDLVRLISSECLDGLFVIGDPDQAIYSFRGSDPAFMRCISEDIPEIQTMNLTRSYRSSDIVLNAASRVLGGNRKLQGKGGGSPVIIHYAETDRAEADWIAASIEAELGGVRSFSRDSEMSDGENRDGRSPDDIAILCRASFMFPVLEKALADHGIPFKKAGDEPFWRREPYRSAINILARYFRNRHFPSNFGTVPLEVIDRIDQGRQVDETLLLLMEANGCSALEIDNLTSVARQWGNETGQFLNRIAYLESIDVTSLSHTVQLMTIHASKGLEFASVYVPGCEEGIIPFTLFGNSDIDEEARLLYVAMTRSSHRLFLSWSASRHYGKRRLHGVASPFLARIDPSLTLVVSRDHKRESDGQLSLFGE